jgi:hypothetical protein
MCGMIRSIFCTAFFGIFRWHGATPLVAPRRKCGSLVGCETFGMHALAAQGSIAGWAQ